MDYHTTLKDCDLQAIMSIQDPFKDGERICDLTLKSISSSNKFYMMESDARQLAKWILENTES